MTKRRSSISGRGAEILLGKPSPVEVQPRSPAEEEFPEAEPLAESAEDSTSESPPAPLEAEVLFEDPEIEKALKEEEQKSIIDLEKRISRRIIIIGKENFHIEQCEITL